MCQRINCNYEKCTKKHSTFKMQCETWKLRFQEGITFVVYISILLIENVFHYALKPKASER